MATKKIKFSNVKENQYGLQVGYKNGEEWENYYVNDKSLSGLIKKGEWATIDYKENAKGNLVITGVTPESSNSSNGGGGKKDFDVETSKRQTCIHAAATVLVALVPSDQTITVETAGDLVGAIANRIYSTVWPSTFRGDDKDSQIGFEREADDDSPF